MQHESTPAQETRFHRIKYLADRQETLLKALPTSIDMEDEDYQADTNKVSAFMQRHPAPKMIIDLRQFMFTVSPAMQDWVAMEVTPVWYATGLRKIAVLMPEDFFANLSLEQTAEEFEISSRGQIAQNYFSNIDAARKWLHAD